MCELEKTVRNKHSTNVSDVKRVEYLLFPFFYLFDFSIMNCVKLDGSDVLTVLVRGMFVMMKTCQHNAGALCELLTQLWLEISSLCINASDQRFWSKTKKRRRNNNCCMNGYLRKGGTDNHRLLSFSLLFK